MKGAALARGTLDPQFAPHEGDQLSADRQAKAGAAVFPRIGGVSLFEAVEDLSQFVRGDADAGVGDAAVEADPALCRLT